jgi:hypothetical protein
VGLRVYFASAIAVGLTVAAPARAAEWPLLPSAWQPPIAVTPAPVPNLDYFMPRPVPAWQAELGARFWSGGASTGKTLFDVPSASSAMVSRLTYSKMTVVDGELFGRVGFWNGLFIKGYAGGGGLVGGNLKDEDFPPGIDPYSSTNSNQHGGELAYASADLGYDVVRGGDFRVGAFAGYHYFDERMNALGCAQTATNPMVCQPPIPYSVEVISQNNHWQSLRVGLDGAVRFTDRFTLTADAAFLPLVFLNGADTHWLRIGQAVGDFAGPIPETGRGYGYQVDLLLSYRVTESISVGIGGRYWHMQANGTANFAGNVVGETAFAQPVDWKTDVLGAFVQASLKLGPYPIGSLN